MLSKPKHIIIMVAKTRRRSKTTISSLQQVQAITAATTHTSFHPASLKKDQSSTEKVLVEASAGYVAKLVT